ncbi:SWI/SNF and RSC complexes subunit ssr2 [Astathelohania contejeani]|uniref:SWI/SNF and RSC complexes subunit ssr2 n=1 Tax=Astathelohania contejeani TaxID=164912 RepID=A0ABQ7I2J0_9MICR|nr:SWI/SNF and RSC complexes subunit ssr2 [Thelohania contejeani]
MNDKYPCAEEVEFEKLYGEKRSDAQPHVNPKMHNMEYRPTASIQTIPTLIPSYSTWFTPDSISDIERRTFPELLNSSPTSENLYKECRNRIYSIYQASPHKYLGIADIKKQVPCELTLLIKIHGFMEKWGLINYRIEYRRDSSALHKRLRMDAEPIVKRMVGVTEPLTPTPDIEPVPVITCRDSIIPESITCRCNKVVNDNFYFTEEDKVYICENCFKKGNYPSHLTQNDFFKLDKNVIKQVWTKDEELLLLEAIEKYEDNWDKVEQHVKSKTKEQCILHFLKMPIQDRVVNKHLAEMSSAIAPLCASGNPIMSVIAFLCSCVHPRVASEAAKWAIKTYDQGMERMVSTALACSAIKAKEQMDLEDKKIERLMGVLVESLHKKIELKLDDFRLMTEFVEKERMELKNARESYLKEIEELRNYIKGIKNDQLNKEEIN